MYMSYSCLKFLIDNTSPAVDVAEAVDTKPDEERFVDVDLTGKFRLNFVVKQCDNYTPFTI